MSLFPNSLWPCRSLRMLPFCLALALGGTVAAQVLQTNERPAIPAPAAHQGLDAKQSPVADLVVNVRQDGSVIVEGEKLSLDQLQTRLRALAKVSKGQAVILRGDAKTEYQKIVGVLDTCQKAGVWNVSFATRLPEDSRTAPAAAGP